MLRFVAILAALALLPAAARAGDDEADPGAVIDTEDPRPPRPRPDVTATIENPVASVSAVLRFPSGIGVDVAGYPDPQLQIGVQVASCILFSEASLYTRLRVLHDLANDLTIGARIHRIAILPIEEEQTSFNLGSLEIGYAHRSGRRLIAVVVGDSLRANGTWGFGIPTGEVQLGYLW